MDEEQKLEILSSILDFHHTNKDEHLFWCKFCPTMHHKPKLSINFKKNTYKCWVCDAYGSDIFYVVRKFGTNKEKQMWGGLQQTFESFWEEEKEQVAEEKVELPKCFVPLWDKKNSSCKNIEEAYNYLFYTRGLSDVEILKWGLGCCVDGKYAGRIIIPSYNSKGEINFFIGRSYKKKLYPSYKVADCSKDIIFNDYNINWYQPITLVEGFFDIKDDTCIPLLGSTISTNSKLFKKIVFYGSVVYVALDKDAFSKSLKMIEFFLEYDIDVYIVDTRGFSDVGVMSKEKFLERKMEAEKITHNNYIELRMAMW